MSAQQIHAFCVKCGHKCHCVCEERSCSFWEPGKFKNNTALEWCECKPCVHGKPEDLAECNRCGVVVRYDEAWKHDCRKIPVAQKI